ncbi:MAG TPA: aminotransferase class IV [Vicinamibacterales bacterium]|nr:aminotransferase class IV [Vicinamibacterales bacterium]
MPVVYVNGRITDAAGAVIPVFDHGFLYGEGVYETLRTYGGEPFLFDAHMRRLRRSGSMIHLEVPGTDDEMMERIRETMAAEPGLKEAYIRILVTRGVGELTYNLAATPTPSIVIIVKPFPEPPAAHFTDGIALALVSVRRNHPSALNPRIKSNNLLNNALAMQEALRQGAEEALMLNQQDEIAECSQSNFFIVKDGGVLTPPLTAGLLPGITREFVLDVAHEAGVPSEERTLTTADMWAADEAFITGTTREITPVVKVDGRPFGDGRPGPITLKLLEAFRAKARG